MAFGSFIDICSKSALPVCNLLGAPTTITSIHNPMIVATCSARSIEVANTIVFQAATDCAHLAALFMTIVMIFHVRSKFTAVGRKEILTFFYLYMLLTIISLVLDAGVLQATNYGPFPFFVAAQNGLTSALCTSLLVNGFVGFQLYEDGTKLSVWLLRLSSLAMFLISFAVSLLTFKGWAGLGPQNTTGMFIVLYIINAICIFVYFVMQFMLVINTLQDRWPLGDLFFGVFFFVIGQVILYVFAQKICEGVSHYLDGLFFATVCNLLAVMMVYKYWDSITREDLEFSVGTKQGNWDLKEGFLDANNMEDYRSSMYGINASVPNFSQPVGSNRDSLGYDSQSLDYRTPNPPHHQRDPRPLSKHSGHRASYSNLSEARNSYADVTGTTGTTGNGTGGNRSKRNSRIMANTMTNSSYEDYDDYRSRNTAQHRQQSRERDLHY